MPGVQSAYRDVTLGLGQCLLYYDHGTMARNQLVLQSPDQAACHMDTTWHCSPTLPIHHCISFLLRAPYSCLPRFALHPCLQRSGHQKARCMPHTCGRADACGLSPTSAASRPGLAAVLLLLLMPAAGSAYFRCSVTRMVCITRQIAASRSIPNCVQCLTTCTHVQEAVLRYKGLA